MRSEFFLLWKGNQSTFIIIFHDFMITSKIALVHDKSKISADNRKVKTCDNGNLYDGIIGLYLDSKDKVW